MHCVARAFGNILSSIQLPGFGLKRVLDLIRLAKVIPSKKVFQYLACWLHVKVPSDYSVLQRILYVCLIKL